MLKKNDPLPDGDRVVRNVPWKKLLKDEDDNLLGGFLPIAFELRSDDTSPSGLEESLSVNWLEYFPDAETRIRDCVWAMRKARKLGSKSAFAVGQVGAVKQVCLARSFKVRVIYEPEDGNLSHAGIRRLPPNDLSLMDALATEAFPPTDMVMNSEIPKEPGT
jgi:hypothetical protein